MNYKIIASSSKGNALLIENKILIDCGVPFSKLKQYVNDLKIIFLTHIHSDHLNKTTIHKLSKERPTLKFICSSYVAPILIANCQVSKKNIIVLETNKTYDLGMFKCKMYDLYHDVPNVAYMIQYNGKKIFYATDTGRIDHIEEPNCDYVFLEANYESDEILDQQIQESEEKGEFTHLVRVKDTHLSQVQCMDWIYKNRGDNTEYVWVHQHIDKGRKEENEITNS